MTKGGGEIEMKRVNFVAALALALMLVAGQGVAAGGSASPNVAAHVCPPAC